MKHKVDGFIMIGVPFQYREKYKTSPLISLNDDLYRKLFEFLTPLTITRFCFGFQAPFSMKLNSGNFCQGCWNIKIEQAIEHRKSYNFVYNKNEPPNKIIEPMITLPYLDELKQRFSFEKIPDLPSFKTGRVYVKNKPKKHKHNKRIEIEDGITIKCKNYSSMRSGGIKNGSKVNTKKRGQRYYSNYDDLFTKEQQMKEEEDEMKQKAEDDEVEETLRLLQLERECREIEYMFEKVWIAFMEKN